MTETYSAPDKRRPPEPRVPAPATAKRTATAHSKAATDLLDDVSTDRLRADVAALAAFHTRHTFSTHIAAAADHLVARFHSLGHPGAGKRAWTRLGHTGQNVVAIKPGVAPAPRTVILGAHYDSRMQTASDATSRAPGADDNASGVAAVLEIARLLGGVDLVDTVHFVCFSGEEQGLWGSTEYAAQLEADGVGVHWMINLDMIGHPPADGSVTVERDTGNAVPGNDSASLALGAVMSQAATDYTTLPVMLGPIYSSDYMPFEARGWVTVGAYEGEGNPHYHQTSDDVGTVDYSYLTQVTRMVLATLLQALPGGPIATGADMAPGEVLYAGQSVSSANSRYVFVYQTDGNLVLYGPAGALWASNTNGAPVGVAIMQGRREPGHLRAGWDRGVGEQHRRQPRRPARGAGRRQRGHLPHRRLARVGRPEPGCPPVRSRAGTTWPPARCSTPGSRSAPRTSATSSRTRPMGTWCSTDPRALCGRATPTVRRSGVAIMQGRREPGHLRAGWDRGVGEQHRRQPRRPARGAGRRQRGHLPDRRLRRLGHRNLAADRPERERRRHVPRRGPRPW